MAIRFPWSRPSVQQTVTPPGGAPTTTTEQPSWQQFLGQGGLLGSQGGFNRLANPFSRSNPVSGALNQVANQSQQAQQQAQAQKDAAAAAEKEKTDSDAKTLLQQLTARRLMMLRQQVGGQQNRNIGMLRRNLAQRGALDSGSLGAGLTSLGNESSNILAQGTQMAANQEAEGLLDFLKRNQAMQFSREQADADRQSRMAMVRLQADLERRNQPSGIESLLAGLGGSAGRYLPFALFGDEDDK